MLLALTEAFAAPGTLALSGSGIATHIGFAVALLVLSLLTTRVMLKHVRIMDHPTARSAHQTATPKGGGLSIVLTFLVGVVVLYLTEPARINQGYFLGFVGSSVIIAAVSFYDDVEHKPFLVKLYTQLLAVAVVLGSGILIDEISLPWIGPVELGWLGWPLSFLWIIGLTNAFNFMDGLDGLAAGTAAIVSFFFLVITFSLGSSFVYIHCYTLLAGALGFLAYNFPPARIFMGDVGSATLGFVFATLAIIAARYDASHTSFMVVPLLLFTFIYDTAFTFVRRWLYGENVTEPHRSHLYQLLNRLGYSHRTVALLHYAAALALGCLAVWMTRIEGSTRAAVFVPVLLVHVAYSVWVMRQAHRHGLLGGGGPPEAGPAA
jgi:UDP-GlcNAc:undecaprenyl-phosphate GlcNAc-1-phosphate transferase